MNHPRSAAGKSRRILWIGIALLAIGLLGHLLAAHETGNRPIDYQHHVAGFVIIGAAAVVIIGPLGWRFWKGRRDVTTLVVGAIQALFGLFVYIERFSVAASW